MSLSGLFAVLIFVTVALTAFSVGLGLAVYWGWAGAKRRSGVPAAG